MLPYPLRRTDSRLQGLVLCRHLAGLAELLPETLRQEYMHNCEQLLCGDSQAFQHVGQTLGDMAGQELLPKDLLCLLLTSLRLLFGEGEGKRDLPEPARRGSLWVSLGLLQIQTWLPQARFDPAVKREYKLRYAKEEVWRRELGHGLRPDWLDLLSVLTPFTPFWVHRASKGQFCSRCPVTSQDCVLKTAFSLWEFL